MGGVLGTFGAGGLAALLSGCGPAPPSSYTGQYPFSGNFEGTRDDENIVFTQSTNVDGPYAQLVVTNSDGMREVFTDFGQNRIVERYERRQGDSSIKYEATDTYSRAIIEGNIQPRFNELMDWVQLRKWELMNVEYQELVSPHQE